MAMSAIKAYRNNVFLPRWREFSSRFVMFDENGEWQKPQLPDNATPLVLLT